MPEPTETTVEGDVEGNVLSGDFSGPVQSADNHAQQTVTVNIQPVPPPPETATHGERIRFLTLAMMQLQSYFVADRNERDQRVKVSDQRYDEARRDRLRTQRWIMIAVGLGALGVLIGLVNTAWIMQWVARFGWVWQ